MSFAPTGRNAHDVTGMRIPSATALESAGAEVVAETLARRSAIHSIAGQLSAGSISALVRAARSDDVYERYAAIQVMGGIAADPGHRLKAMAEDALRRVATDRSGLSGVQTAALTALMHAGSGQVTRTASRLLVQTFSPEASRIFAANTLSALTSRWEKKTQSTLMRVAFSETPRAVRIAALDALHQPRAGLQFDAASIRRLTSSRDSYVAEAGAQVVAGVIEYAATNPEQDQVLNGIVDAFFKWTTQDKESLVGMPDQLLQVVRYAVANYTGTREVFELALNGWDKAAPGYRGLQMALAEPARDVSRALAV
jgi:hypothetical protein